MKNIKKIANEIMAGAIDRIPNDFEEVLGYLEEDLPGIKIEKTSPTYAVVVYNNNEKVLQDMQNGVIKIDSGPIPGKQVHDINRVRYVQYPILLMLLGKPAGWQEKNK